MIHKERTVDIDATPEQVWAVLGRYMHMHDFAPRIVSIDALTEGPDGVGSQRRCHFADGSSVVEEVTEWKENSHYTLRLIDTGPMPVKDGHATLSVTALPGGGSRATMAMDLATASYLRDFEEQGFVRASAHQPVVVLLMPARIR